MKSHRKIGTGTLSASKEHCNHPPREICIMEITLVAVTVGVGGPRIELAFEFFLPNH